MLDYINGPKGKFDTLCDVYQDDILELVALFHIRNGVKHKDGSLGDIRITLNELKDCLAYKLSEGSFGN